MTSPAGGGAGGFRIARGFVEITGEIDRDAIRRDAVRVAKEGGEDYAKAFSDAASARFRGQEGRALTSSINPDTAGAKAGGSEWAGSFAGAARERLRGPDGRFISKALDEQASPEEGTRRGRGLGGALAAGAGTALRGTKAIAEGVMGAVSALPPQVKAALGVALVAVGGPLIAAGVAGAVAGGVGAGGVAGGFLVAMKDPAIRVRAKQLGQEVGQDLGQAAGPFRETTLRVLDQIGDRSDKLQPRLASIFRKSAPFAEKLVDGLLDGVEGFAKGFDDALDDAGPGVDALAYAFAQLGTGVGNALKILTEGSDDGGRALRDLVNVVSYLIQNFALMMRAVTEVYGGIRKAAEWIGILDKAQDGARRSGGGYFDELERGGGALENITEESSAYQQRQAVLNRTTREAIEITGDYAKALDVLNGAAQSAEEATLDYEDALAEANKKLREYQKDSKKSAQDNRDMRRTLLDVASAAKNNAAAAYDDVFAATGNVTRAQQAANGKMREGREAFLRLADGMKMPKAEAKALADRIFGIPGSRKTTLSVEKGAAQAALAAYEARLRRIPQRWRTVIDVAVGNVENAARRARDAARAGNAKGGDVRAGRAIGGETMAAPYLVGEDGPELFYPDRNGTMMTASQTKAILSGLRREVSGWEPGPAAAGAGGQGVYIGSVVLDMSRLRDIEDVVRMVKQIAVSARAHRARIATAPGV